MGLHRDIHWLGKQWAVTGFGMQAIDKKLGGKFDVEIARLWEEGLADRLREGAGYGASALSGAFRRATARSAEFPGTRRTGRSRASKISRNRTAAATTTGIPYRGARSCKIRAALAGVGETLS